MTTNDILVEIHDALVEKAATRIKVDGKAKVAAEIGNAIIEYGKCWTEGLSDDGALSKEEAAAIRAKFNTIVTAHVPSYEGSGVNIAWNGLSLFGLGWKGLKSYLNKWFGLAM